MDRIKKIVNAILTWITIAVWIGILAGVVIAFIKFILL